MAATSAPDLKAEFEDATELFSFRDLDMPNAKAAFLQAIKASFQAGLVTQQQYEKARQGSFSTATCIMSAYAAKKGANSGYTQVRYKTKKYDLHRLACALRSFRDGSSDEEASHLCPDGLQTDRRGCFNPAHLYWELGQINKSRLCCQLFHNTTGYKCPHNIPCLVGECLHQTNNITNGELHLLW